jgi:hypothetical protein
MSRRSWGWRLAVFLVGCGGPPKAPPAARRLVEALLTAVSARNPEWLRKNIAAVAKAELDPALRAAFDAIHADAQAEKWAEAKAAAYRLRDAQR